MRRISLVITIGLAAASVGGTGPASPSQSTANLLQLSWLQVAQPPKKRSGSANSPDRKGQ